METIDLWCCHLSPLPLQTDRASSRSRSPSLNLWRHATNVVIVVIIAGAAFTHYRQTLLALGGDAALWVPLSLPPSVPLPPPFIIVQRVKSGSIVGRSDRVSRTFSAHFHADSDTTNNMTSVPRHQTAALGERRKQKEPWLGLGQRRQKGIPDPSLAHLALITANGRDNLGIIKFEL